MYYKMYKPSSDKYDMLVAYNAPLTIHMYTISQIMDICYQNDNIHSLSNLAIILKYIDLLHSEDAYNGRTKSGELTTTTTYSLNTIYTHSL